MLHGGSEGLGTGSGRQRVPTGPLACFSPPSQCSCAGAQLVWPLLAFFRRISEQGLPCTSLPPGLVLAHKLLCQAERAKAEPEAPCSLTPSPLQCSARPSEEEKWSLMCWDHRLGTGTVLDCAALASCVSLLQDKGTLGMRISRTKVIPWCHIPLWLQPWLLQQCYSEGLYHRQGNGPHMVPQVLPPPMAQSVLPGDYLYLDEDGE